MSVTPQSHDNIEIVEQAVEEMVRDLLKNGVTEQELAAAKKRLITASVYAQDSLQGPAMAVGRALSVGLPLEVVEFWPERIESLSVADINRAARFVFLPESHQLPSPVTAILTPPYQEKGEFE
jgi:zinc protease